MAGPTMPPRPDPLLEQIVALQRGRVRLREGVAAGASSVYVAGSSDPTTVAPLGALVAGDRVHVLQAGATPPLALGMGEDWHYIGNVGEPAFQNGWSNYTGGGDVFVKARFRKDPFGIVTVEGSVAGGSSANSIPFLLPARYRPDKVIPFVCVSPDTSYDNPARVDANPSGSISIVQNGSTVVTFLNGIRYRAVA